MIRTKKNILPAHYDSLDAPVFIWQKVHDTHDLSWLLVKRQKITDTMRKSLEKIWDYIYDEFIREFGISDAALQIHRKEIHIAQMQCDMIISNDRSIETFIEIEQQELEGLKTSLGKVDFQKTKIAIEAHYKFQVNVMTTSIKEFYSYLKDLK